MTNSDITNLLRDRIDGVESAGVSTRKMLSSHIEACEATQKKVLVLSACILTWMVVHSPEVLTVTEKLIKLAKLIGLL